MELSEAVHFVKTELTYNWTEEAAAAIDTLIAHARRSLDAPVAALKEDGGGPNNLWIAANLIADIESVRAVQREIRSAFARSELDGGVKAAPRHPLYIEAEERLAELHDQLMMVI